MTSQNSPIHLTNNASNSYGLSLPTLTQAWYHCCMRSKEMTYTPARKAHTHTPRSKALQLKYVAVIALFLLLVGATLTILEVTNVTHFFHNKPLAKHTLIPTVQPTKNSSGSTTNGSSNSTSNTPSSTPSSSTVTTKGSGSAPTPQPSGPPTTAALAAPYGTFLSNHNPDLSGSPYPNQEVSVCSTTPGASCTIIFTMDGTTRTLPSQTVDSSGSTSWSWKVTADAGFAVGTWQATVEASLNGETKTAHDTLVVGP